MSYQEDKLFTSELQRAWKYRNGQDLVQAEKQYNHLYRTYKNKFSLNPILQNELINLKASLLRAEGQLQSSNEILTQVKVISEQNNLEPSEYYFLQKGLNLYYEGYFTSALEFFIICEKISQDQSIKTLALGNHLLCLDALNLPADKIFKRLTVELKKLDSDDFNRSMAPGLDSFVARQLFYQGEIEKLFAMKPDKQIWQLQWLQIWVSNLPYINSSSCPVDVSSIASSQRLLWKNYRLKTISAGSTYESAENVKVSERVDRLYLWTWRWLLNPSTVDISVYAECWNDIEPADICNKSTSEDLVLLRLCLRWNSLLNSKWHHAAANWISKSLPPNLITPPIFELEGLVLDYLEAIQKKDRSSTKKLKLQIQNHPLFKKTTLLFQEIIQPKDAESRWGELLQKISGQTKNSIATKENSVDLTNFTWKINGAAGISAPVCKFLNLIYQKQVVTFAEALDGAFDIPTYDDEVHRAKIANLLSRVRKILPNSVSLLSRQDRIYLEGQGLKLNFHRPSQKMTIPIPKFLSTPCIKQNQNHLDRWIQPKILIAHWNENSTLTRHDLQERLRLSKASANRLLTRWCNEGFLKALNSGRATRYRLDMTQFNRLKNSAS